MTLLVIYQFLSCIEGKRDVTYIYGRVNRIAFTESSARDGEHLAP